jgi:hypothetical protein
VRRLLVTASVVISSSILVTMMMEAIRSSETSVLTRATGRNIPEDVILHVSTYLPASLCTTFTDLLVDYGTKRPCYFNDEAGCRSERQCIHNAPLNKVRPRLGFEPDASRN